ncbi:MAG TPA: calmodulin [Gammaproteobacteria bacterium]
MRKMPIATALVLLAASAVQAETQPGFQSLDADANGYLSQQEAASNADVAKRWTDLDTNKDNMLDKSEFSAFEIDTGGDMNQAPAQSTPRY